MFQGGVGCQDRVVRLNNRVGHRWGGVNGELKLRLLAIVGRETLENEGPETGTSSTTKGVEDKEALETTAVVCQAANLIHHIVDLLLANSVVTTSVWYGKLSATTHSDDRLGKNELTIAGGIFLASNQSLRVEKTPICAASNLIDDIWLEIDVERTRHMLARRCL